MSNQSNIYIPQTHLFAMKKSLLIIIFLLILPLASAEIFINQQPNNLYSRGDSMATTITIKSSTDMHDFFSISILCNERRIELLKQAVKVKAGQEQIQSVELSLDPSVIGDVNGTCSFVITYAGEQIESSKFELSKDIEIAFLLDNVVADPSQPINVEGTITKANGSPLNGVVEVFFSEIDAKETAIVTNGSFVLSIKTPKNTPAGNYRIIAHAYEKNTEGTMLNEGSASHEVSIEQAPQELNIAIETPSITPNETFLYTVHLYDQTGNEIAQETSVIVFKPKKEVFGKSLIISGIAQNISLETSSPPGLWKIQAIVENISKERTFIVEEFFHLDFNVINNTLIIKNTGNVKYTKPIEINIGSVKEIKDLSLEIGELKSFNLFAPDGEYNLVINDGKSLKELGQVSLTGQSVAVREPGERAPGSFLYVWIILLIVLAIIIILAIRKLIKKGYLNSLKTIFLRISPSSRQVQSKPSYLINQGKKQEVMVLSLHVKNLAELESSENGALDVLKAGIDKAKNSAVKMHEEGNTTLFIFPLESQDNLLAVQVGKTLEETLNAYNQSHKENISFGLAIHVGTIIAETKTDSKMHFTALGNLMTIVKRIAHNSNKALCLSEQAYRKLVGKVKATHIPEKNVWQVTELPNRSAYGKFIKGFLKRQEFS